MYEPLPKEYPTTVHIKVFGGIAIGTRDALQLPPRKEDKALKAKFEQELAAERKARKEAGYDGFLPEREPFDDGEVQVDENKKVGVPDVHIGDYVTWLYTQGYFLIAKSYEEELVGERKRPQSRLVFSRKEEDRPLELDSPPREKVELYFSTKVFGYLHYHDRRRHHPGIDKEIGPVLVDLAGHILRTEHCRQYRKLEMVESYPHAALSVAMAPIEIIELEEPIPSVPLTYTLPDMALKKQVLGGRYDIRRIPELMPGQRRYDCRR